MAGVSLGAFTGAPVLLPLLITYFLQDDNCDVRRKGNTEGEGLMHSLSGGERENTEIREQDGVERERQRQRQRDRETERHRETERKTETERPRNRDRESF